MIDKAENVRIVGRGILDHPIRGIEVTHSKNIWIDGITVINPDHYTVFGGESKGLTINNLKSFSCKGWSDGIDLMCCSDVCGTVMIVLPSMPIAGTITEEVVT